MMRLVGLLRIRDDPMDMVLVCLITPLSKYRPPRLVEMRRREAYGLQEGDIMWVYYEDYVWYQDTHEVAFIKQTHFY